MPNNPENQKKRCSLCFRQRQLSEFMSISKAMSSKKLFGTVCSSCLGIDSSKFHLHTFQKKLKRLFNKINNSNGIFKNSNKQDSDDDEGGSGGKQLQKSRNVETLANEIALTKEQAKLAEKNLLDQKQKKLFEKHKKSLSLTPEETALHEQDDDHNAETEADKEKDKKSHEQELENSEQDEVDAIAGKVQRDHSGSRRNDRAAKLGQLGFGIKQQPSSRTPGNNKSNHLNRSTAESKAEHIKGNTKVQQDTHTSQNKSELQKTASLLFHTPQPHAADAPAPARISNKVGASPSKISSDLFADKTSGDHKTAQQKSARNSQSAEALEKTEKELQAALRATKARWGR